MITQRESLLKQGIPRRRVAESEQEGALRRDVAARAARGPRRLTVPAHHLAPRQLEHRRPIKPLYLLTKTKYLLNITFIIVPTL